MPFKFSNILNKDRRASASSTSEIQPLDEPVDEEPEAFRPPVKSISLSGPRLTVTDADQSSPRSVNSSQQRFSDYSASDSPAPSLAKTNGTRSRGNSFDLRVHTAQDAGVGDISDIPYRPRHPKTQDSDDLDTPIASRSEIDIFPRMPAANIHGQESVGNGEGIPSRSYSMKEDQASVPPLATENLNLGPGLETSYSRQRSTPPKPPPLPLRSIQVEPNVLVSSPSALPSAFITDSPGLAPPDAKPRSSSISSQRSQRASGVAALISSSSSIASSTSVPVPHVDIFHSVKSKVKDKVRKHKHRKRSEAEGDGMRSNRSSIYSTEDGDDHSVISGRRRSGTEGSSISKRLLADGRHNRSNSDASSAAHPMMDGHSVYSDEDDDDDDDETDSGEETDEDDARSSFMSRGSLSLPVTGFAVASTKRNQDFHALFPEVDEDDYLIEDYGCALQKDILVQGRIYASENHLCFHANIFGWVTNVVIPFADVISMEKKMTAFVIPNAICVSTKNSKHTFASFISRDSTHDVFKNIWRQSRPSDPGVQRVTTRESRLTVEDSIAPTSNGRSPSVKTTGRHGPTTCKCGDAGEHYQHTAMDATFASSPDKIHSLMFSSGFAKEFMVQDQKLLNLEMSDWKPISAESHLATRSMSYIKPLGGGVGPKQTACHIVDEAEFFDPDKFISMITTTKTPDVPSGGVFSVKTRTCLTWAGANSTRVVVTTQVEFTGKSWIKNLIDKSAVDGQKTYHRDLERAMRAYIKEHATEFAREGGDGETISEEEAAAEQEAAVAETKIDEAAAARRKREEDEKSNLQWAIDRIVDGGKTLFGGIWSLVSTVVEMLGDAPITKEMWLGLLILLLLVSNIWTYVSLRNERLSDKSTTLRNARRRHQRHGLQTDMEDGRSALDMADMAPAEEAAEVMRMMDEVERRVAELRRRVAVTNLDTLE